MRCKIDVIWFSTKWICLDGAMALSLIGYFFSMLSVLATSVFVLYGALSLTSPHQSLAPSYAPPAAYDDTAADSENSGPPAAATALPRQAAMAQSRPPIADSMEAQQQKLAREEGARRKRIKLAQEQRRRLVQQRQDQVASTALGYSQEPTFGFSASLFPPRY